MIETALTVPELSKIEWLEHGFGTKAGPVPQYYVASLKQTHSVVVLATSEPGCAGEGDALVANTPGLAISIRTADCYPILLADPEHRAVAAVHAGWRGTAGQVVRRTIDRMCSDFDTSPGNLIVAIGPGIGACCYKVGEEVAQRFEEFGINGAGPLDLARINHEQLVRAGVPASQIDTIGRCTRCEPESFHSYRRDKEDAGRMVSFIRIRE